MKAKLVSWNRWPAREHFHNLTILKSEFHHQPTFCTVGQLVFLISATYLGNTGSKSFFETIFWLGSTCPRFLTILGGVSSAKFFLLLSSARIRGGPIWPKSIFKVLPSVSYGPICKLTYSTTSFGRSWKSGPRPAKSLFSFLGQNRPFTWISHLDCSRPFFAILDLFGPFLTVWTNVDHSEPFANGPEWSKQSRMVQTVQNGPNCPEWSLRS